MKRTINIITLVLLLYFATEAQALDYNQLKRYDITDPSPMAMQYLQVTSPQPALLTGAVQFSVPLYTAECEGIKLPFSLEYKSNGVKVYDEPCPVGYGWTFLPAFRVSCRIMGRPDTQYRSKAQDGAHINDWNDRTKYEYAYRSVTSYPYDTYTDYVTHESKNTQRHDAEHDIYTIMLPDRNLTVVWDRDFTNGFVGVNIDDYKIEADSLLSYIRVTDPKGYVYHYGEAGEEHIATRCQTEWLLSWIQLPSGRRITFEWESGDTVTDNMFQVSPVVLIYPIAYYNIFASEQQRDVLRSRLEYLNHKIIKRVTLPNATVNLSYANYCSGSFLSSMSVTNIDNENIFSSYLDYNISNREVDLSSVTVRGIGTYQFEYHSGSFEYECDQDWWGYANGAENYVLNPDISIMGMNAGNDGLPMRVYGADRGINATYMKSHLLRTVRYPTGGHVTWDVEPHRFAPTASGSADMHGYMDDTPLSEGGGLRVTRVSLYENDNDQSPLLTTYTYGQDGNGLANVNAAPSPATFISANVKEVFSGGLRGRIVIDNTSHCYDWHIGELPIWYSEVQVNNDEGKTIYKFEDICDANMLPGGYLLPYNMSLNKAFSDGPQLMSVTAYTGSDDSGYTLASKTEYEYQLCRNNPMGTYGCWSVAVERMYMQFYPYYYPPDLGEINQFNFFEGTLNGPWVLPEEWIRDIYKVYPYKINFLHERLKKKKVTTYYDNSPSKWRCITENYTYKDGTTMIATVSTDVSAFGSQLPGCVPRQAVSYLRYPDTPTATNDSIMAAMGLQCAALHTPQNVISGMLDKNITGVPLMAVEKIGSSAVINENEYSMSDAQPGYTMPRICRHWSSRGTSQPHKICEIDYDGTGNPRQLSYPGGHTVTCLWGYNGTLPAYRIDGATFAQVASVAGQDAYGSSCETITADMSGLGLVTRYQWKPMVGLTKTTNPSGLFTTYSYDDYNRLYGVYVRGYMTDRYTYQPASNRIMHNIYHYDDVNSYRAWADTETSVYDGLGRTRKSFYYTAADSVTTAKLKEYDGMSRLKTEWCAAPVVSVSVSESAIKSSAVSYYGDNMPYSEFEYQKSQAAELCATQDPGQILRTANVRTTTQRHLNLLVGKYSCPVLTFDGTTLTRTGSYPNGYLEVEETTDEDGMTVLVFRDFLGRKLLERRSITSYTYADTHYVYNDYGDLVCILQPEFSVPSSTLTANSSEMRDKAFVYTYDELGRMTQKRLPGAGPIMYRYDDADRLVAEQTPLMRSLGKWQCHYYDRMGRPVVNTYVSATDEQINQLCGTVRTASLGNAANIRGGYVISPAHPDYGTTELVSAEYYDNYDFINLAGTEAPLLQFSADSIALTRSATPRGLCTGRYVKGAGYSAYYYNNLEQCVEERSTGEYPRTVTRKIKRDGSTLKYMSLTVAGDTLLAYYVSNSYDHSGRLVSTSINTGGHTATIGYGYNQVGQLDRESYGRARVESSFDVAGRLTQRKYMTSNFGHASLFSLQTPPLPAQEYYERLYYAAAPQSVTSGFRPKYSGLVSARECLGKGYTYTYDNNGRLTKASSIQHDTDFTASYVYDKNSNLRILKRNGIIEVDSDGGYVCGMIDNLSFTYNGNQLASVSDSGDDAAYDGAPGFFEYDPDGYDYDEDGNLIMDYNRGIEEIAYDVNGMPLGILFADRHCIRYDYSGDGRLMSVSLYALPETESAPGMLHPTEPRPEIDDSQYLLRTISYAGEHVLVDGVPAKTMLPAGAGYIDAQGDLYYWLKDYQGNNIILINEIGTLVDSISYYPYGQPIVYPSTGQNHTPAGSLMASSGYLYSGKEYIQEAGYNAYDFGARHLGTGLPLWNRIDPLCEDSPGISPYVYCAANPVMFVDPTGERTYIFNNTGHLSSIIDNDEDDKLIVDDGTDNRPTLLLEYGTIKYATYNYSLDNDLMLVMELEGDDNVNKAFEFMAKNTNVEWSGIFCGIEGSGSGFITTSNDFGEEHGMTRLVNTQLKYGYAVRMFNHSHPRKADHHPSGDDVSFAKNVRKYFWPTVKCNVYVPHPLNGLPYYIPF